MPSRSPALRLYLYNTRSRKRELIKSLAHKKIGLYTCGPTVYDFAHIGNLRTYIFEDVLERALRMDGYAVKRVMNITDVGHLTSDADEGEDKLEKGAARERKHPLEIARMYTDAFLRDIKALNILVPKTLAPATKFIDKQIAIVKILMKKGYAYETSAAVYFDVSKFRQYGKLAGQSLKEKMTAVRKEVVADPHKRNPADFVLWFKRTGRFANHILHWPSPWGDGFPGWHIECSAISKHFLGQPFDIHTGGVDHIGTHHTNEIAQSEAAFGMPLATYWIHGEHLLVDGAKMSKSLGNFYTLADIEARGISPLAFRYLVLGAHYRSRLNFTWKSLNGAAAALEHLYETYREVTFQKPPKSRAGAVSGIYQDYLKKFLGAVNDDLNTPQALAVMNLMAKDAKLPPREKAKLFEEFEKVLGLDFNGVLAKKWGKREKIPREILDLARKREEYRRNKQFVQADALRDELDRLGYTVDDTESGPKVRRNAAGQSSPAPASRRSRRIPLNPI